MLHVWLIPALVVLALIILSFYVVVKVSGGTGVRTEGRTLMDKPEPEEDMPPAVDHCSSRRRETATRLQSTPRDIDSSSSS